MANGGLVSGSNKMFQDVAIAPAKFQFGTVMKDNPVLPVIESPHLANFL
jgi:hypothetical protein